MKAYLVADIEVTDPAGYAEYRKTVGESIAAFGGRFLTRGGTTEVLEGNWNPKRLVIVEFPTMERLRGAHRTASRYYSSQISGNVGFHWLLAYQVQSA